MNEDQAEHISLLAAPLLAMMLKSWIEAGCEVPADALREMRRSAIVQAQALWLATLEAE